jgi:hypothetical protein
MGEDFLESDEAVIEGVTTEAAVEKETEVADSKEAKSVNGSV